MKYITSAINSINDPAQSDSQKDLALQTLKDYYNQNIAAHREYLEKKIYDIIPEMIPFKNEMDEIEGILNKALQLKLF